MTQDESTQIEHISKNAFFSYIGILVTIWLLVNSVIVSFMFQQISAVEDRANVRIDRIQETNAELTNVITDVRISLQRIETQLGIGRDQTRIR